MEVLRLEGKVTIKSVDGVVYSDNNLIVLEGKNKILNMLVSGGGNFGVNCIILSYSNTVASGSDTFNSVVYRKVNNVYYHSIIDDGFLHKDLNILSGNLYDENSFSYVINSDGSILFRGVLGKNRGNSLPYNQIWSLNLCGGVSSNFVVFGSGGGGGSSNLGGQIVIGQGGVLTRSSLSGSNNLGQSGNLSNIIIQERTQPLLTVTNNEFLLARKVLSTPIIKSNDSYLLFEWLIKLV